MKPVQGDMWLNLSNKTHKAQCGNPIASAPHIPIFGNVTQRPSVDRLDRFARLLEAVRYGRERHREIVDRMRKIGMHPALIHAYWHTGHLLREGTLSLATTQELIDWNVAMNGWERESQVVLPERRWFSDEEYWSLVP